MRPGAPVLGADRPVRVLVLPGGTEIGLEIHKSLAPCRNIELYSAGIDVPNHAPYVFKRHFLVPRFDAAEFARQLERLIAAHEIDFVFPAYDDLIVALAKGAPRLRARVVTSPLETCLICRSKSQTYRHLEGSVPVPRVHHDRRAIGPFPVFAKPDKGQGSERAVVVRDRERLENLLAECNDYVITEYLPGEEFTVDCFTHRTQGLLYCEGRQRIRTRSGISMSSRFAPGMRAEFRTFAAAIGRRLEFHGAWFFQLKRAADGTLKLLEVAPRIAGTMALSRVRGVNFALLSLYEQAGMPVEIMADDGDVEVDRALVNRYRHNVSFATAYVDLDDTLIRRGGVDLTVVRFLYQCVNNGKRIVLLTRHRGDLARTLQHHRLAGLFDEVIHLKPDERKSDSIQGADSILIDDSFRERREAAARLGIRTFDGSMLEMLIDERE